MKTYVKPALTAFSLAGNEVLCSGCADNPVKDPDFAQVIMAMFPGLDQDANGILTNDEVVKAFAQEEACDQKLNSFYCKLTSGSTIIWS